MNYPFRPSTLIWHAFPKTYFISLWLMNVCSWALSLLSVSLCFQRSDAADETAVDCRVCAGFWLCTYYSSCESIPVWKGRGTSAGFVFWPISVMRGHRKAWLQHAEGSFSTCLACVSSLLQFSLSSSFLFFSPSNLLHSFFPNSPLTYKSIMVVDALDFRVWRYNQSALFGRRLVHAPVKTS